MSDRKRKAPDPLEDTHHHAASGNKRLCIATSKMITNTFWDWIRLVGSFIPWTDYTTNTSTGLANTEPQTSSTRHQSPKVSTSPPTSGEDTSIKPRKIRTSTRARTPEARRSKMAARNKGNMAQNAGNSASNPIILPDIESLVEGVDEAEARRNVDSAWMPDELPYFTKRTNLASRPEGKEQDINPIWRIAEDLSESEELGPEVKETKAASSPAKVTLLDPPHNFRSSWSSTGSTSNRASIHNRSYRGHSHVGHTRDGTKVEVDNALVHLFEETGISLRPGTHKLKEQEMIQEKRRKEAKLEADRARKDRRVNRQNPRRPLVAPLSPQWDAAISNIRRLDKQQVITEGLKGTQLTVKDFMTLIERGSWLNDEIINAYLEWVIAAANAAAKEEAETYGEKVSTVPKFIGQNSFFYGILKNKGPDSLSRLMKRLGVPQGPSFLEVDTMLVPINQGLHWTIGVVRPVAKTIEYLDSMGNETMRTSFGGLMRTWLQHQLGALYKEEEWSEPNTKIAKQNNGYDCGVFVCTNALCIAHGIHMTCYVECDMIQQRKNIAAVLMNRGFVKEFDWNKAGLLA